MHAWNNACTVHRTIEASPVEELNSPKGIKINTQFVFEILSSVCLHENTDSFPCQLTEDNATATNYAGLLCFCATHQSSGEHHE